MAGHDIVVIGASAGGVQALQQLISCLPGELPAAVFVVIHFPVDGKSMLPRLLARAGRLPADFARSGEPIETGRIYVAPPNHHLTLSRGHVIVEWGPRINYFRPAIDPLFRSAARAYGPRVIGVLLSGLLRDGSAGLLAIQRAGGLAVIQDPYDALFPEMPANALAILDAPIVQPLSGMAPALLSLIHSPPGRDLSMKDPIEEVTRQAEDDIAAQQRGERRGKVTVLTCPDCGGVLWQVGENGLMEFRCHTGHVLSGDAVVAGQNHLLEKALEVALRALREREVLSEQLASEATKEGDPGRAEQFAKRADLARSHSQVVKEMLKEQAATGGAEAPQPLSA
jgi:two-component system chemotaxis response regulator CheB